MVADTILVAVSALAAGVMGYAIQRGATCMVAALEEVVERRRANRVIALLEAAGIVAGGLAIASVAGLLLGAPPAFMLNGWTILGGALLGVGAFVARACVFGSIAKLGSGEWAYLLVPPGFFLGCVIGGVLLGHMAPQPITIASATLELAPLLLVPFGGLLLWRLLAIGRAAREGRFAAHVWSPHVATSVIGLSFVLLLLAAGPWSYTESLAEAAAGKSMMTGLRMLRPVEEKAQSEYKSLSYE